MIDPTILQFVVGTLAGTVGGLLIVRRRSSTHKTNIRTVQNKSRPVIITNRSRTSPTRSVKSRITASSGVRSKSHTRTSRSRNSTVIATPVHHSLSLLPENNFSPVSTPVPVLSAAVAAAPSFSTCPACGLEAPEDLMAEHLLQSPSHKARRPDPPIVIAIPTSSHPIETGSNLNGDVEEEDPKLSFRNLLQMLVPPRAFGHRAQQRTVNPLSKMVQTIEVPNSPSK